MRQCLRSFFACGSIRKKEVPSFFLVYHQEEMELPFVALRNKRENDHEKAVESKSEYDCTRCHNRDSQLFVPEFPGTFHGTPGIPLYVHTRTIRNIYKVMSLSPFKNSLSRDCLIPGRSLFCCLIPVRSVAQMT